MTDSTRTTLVTAARLPGWVERFSAAHGGLDTQRDTDDGVLLAMGDGATALLSPPWPDDGRPGRGTDLVERLVSLASQERSLGIVLARRGGFAVGVSAGGKLLAHKVGKGGRQAGALAAKAAEEAARIFAGARFEYLATGGDKPLVAAVLAAPSLRSYANRPHLAPLAVADPNHAVLQKAAADFCAVRIRVTDPPQN
ncbi:Vms1/Ankzf1 family peptidyl-tRNA hydrolase [Arthrobacter sp. ERGS1:01]|uniref:Vms1/Ankzf1 family peptidyl-tRNA hydrolase n=1 Tax=Arthrobacter sp. ERGS1:01 TaxID=1704044 RepID=UPI0009EA648F|nr:Vms1/Ankzf1 family peptidyl-tRNA hydrolase [Arthrobacter sp. ERGS1:01]